MKILDFLNKVYLEGGSVENPNYRVIQMYADNPANEVYTFGCSYDGRAPGLAYIVTNMHYVPGEKMRMGRNEGGLLLVFEGQALGLVGVVEGYSLSGNDLSKCKELAGKFISNPLYTTSSLSRGISEFRKKYETGAVKDGSEPGEE